MISVDVKNRQSLKGFGGPRNTLRAEMDVASQDEHIRLAHAQIDSWRMLSPEFEMKVGEDQQDGAKFSQRQQCSGKIPDICLGLAVARYFAMEI